MGTIAYERIIEHSNLLIHSGLLSHNSFTGRSFDIRLLLAYLSVIPDTLLKIEAARVLLSR